MERGIVRLLVIGVLFFVIVLPVRNHLEKKSLNRRLVKQENQTIGSVDMYNSKVKFVQRALQDLRYYAGPIDGKMGEKTRLALRGFQDKKDLDVTGFVDSKTFSEINKHASVLLKSKSKKTLARVSKDPKKPVKDSSSLLDKSSQQSKVQAPVRSENKVPELKVKDIQLALKKSGFYKGNIDGKVGAQTSMAVKEFQLSKNLKSDGVVGAKTTNEFKKILSNNE